MNSLKRKVISTSAIVLFALLTVIGSTFAWITIDSSASINQVELTIGTDVSLLIMMDDKVGGYDYSNPADQLILTDPANGKYVTNLTSGEIKSVYDYTNIELEPISTSNAYSFNRSREHANVTASYSASSTTPGQYIQFSVWILSQAQNSTVTIRNFDATASNSIVFKNQVMNAVRMSIENNQPETEDNQKFYIFGKDKDYLFTYRSDQFGYDSVTISNNSIPALQKTFLESKHAEYYSSIGGDTSVVGEKSTNLALADTVVTLSANVPQKLTIRIWIEGWDEDADNNIMTAAFSVKFDFLVQEATEV